MSSVWHCLGIIINTELGIELFVWEDNLFFFIFDKRKLFEAFPGIIT